MSPSIPRIIFRTFVYIMISIACLMTLQGQLTIGDVTGIVAIGASVVYPVQEINIVWSKWTRASVCIERIAENLSSSFPVINVNSRKCTNFDNQVINTQSKKENTGNENSLTNIPPLQKNLHLKNVSFNYDRDSMIIDEVSVFLPHQGLFSISGGNGSGKSTLLRLIAGDFRPSSGKIYWDDFDLNNFTPAARKQKNPCSSSISFSF